MARAKTVGVHPKFIAMIRELIVERTSPGTERRALGSLGPRAGCVRARIAALRRNARRKTCSAESERPSLSQRLDCYGLVRKSVALGTSRFDPAASYSESSGSPARSPPRC